MHRAERRGRVRQLAEEVGLAASQLDRYPRELSGGQRQRVGLARALATSPALIVADEPVSALDVSVRSQILNLMTELQAEHQLTYLMVSHDLTVIHYFADHIAVMYLGKIVESGRARGAVPRARAPLHPGADRRGARSRSPAGAPRGPRSGASCPRPRRRRRAAGSAPGARRPQAAVRRAGAAAARLRARPPGRVPLPLGEAAHRHDEPA